MASGKRASMREGPLAALFRKTETEGLEDSAEAPEAPEARVGGDPIPEPPRAEERPRPSRRPSSRSRAFRRRRSGCATRSPPTCPRT